MSPPRIGCPSQRSASPHLPWSHHSHCKCIACAGNRHVCSWILAAPCCASHSPALTNDSSRDHLSIGSLIGLANGRHRWEKEGQGVSLPLSLLGAAPLAKAATPSPQLLQDNLLSTVKFLSCGPFFQALIIPPSLGTSHCRDLLAPLLVLGCFIGLCLPSQLIHPL